MGAGGCATGEEKNGGGWALEEETEHLYRPCVGWKKKKRSIFLCNGWQLWVINLQFHREVQIDYL
jgi:hypothetical protein